MEPPFLGFCAECELFGKFNRTPVMRPAEIIGPAIFGPPVVRSRCSLCRNAPNSEPNVRHLSGWQMLAQAACVA